MADWPSGFGGGSIVADSGDIALVLGSGSVNTESSWVELIASTAMAADGFYLNGTGENASYLVDLAIGARRCSSSREASYSSLRLGRATTYGAVTTDSGGIQVDPGGIASTKGSWVEIMSATTNPTSALIVCIGNRANVARTVANFLLDIGIGAAGSEQIVIPDLYFRASAQEDQCQPHFFERFVAIKSGMRIAARAQSSITEAEDRLFDVTIVGLD